MLTTKCGFAYLDRQCKSLSVWNGQQDDSTLEPVYVL